MNENPALITLDFVTLDILTNQRGLAWSRDCTDWLKYYRGSNWSSKSSIESDPGF